MMIMRLFAQVTALCLALLMCTGCGAKKEAPEPGIGTEPVAAAASMEEEEAAAAAESAEEAEEDAAEEAAAPAEQEEAELSFEGNTAYARPEAVYLDENGKLAVKVTGRGYGFNGILPIRNGKIIVPFYADVKVGEKTVSWNSVSMGGGAITYTFDLTELPDEVILYSSDNKDEKFTFEAAPCITDGPPAEQ